MGYLELPQTRCADNIAEACYKCVCLIVRSIVNKKKEFNIMVTYIDPDIIGITEPWPIKPYQMLK